MPDYKEILTAADRFFARIREEQPAALACRAGCTGCCHGLFEISGADLALLADGLETLDAPARTLLLERARAVLESTAHPEIRECTPAEKEAFFERAAEVPCPALGDGGSCLLYEYRPLTCRTFGLPLRDGDAFLGEECHLNFLTATPEELERASWNLQWEDVRGEDEYTIPEAIVLAGRLGRY